MTQIGSRAGAATVGTGAGRNSRGKAAEMAKKRNTRSRQDAVRDLHPYIKKGHQDHLIPTRVLDVSDDEIEYIGQVLAGVQDFKVLRGSVAVCSITTSTEFAHLLTDAAMISRGNILVVDLYQVKRSYVFGEDEDDDDEG